VWLRVVFITPTRENTVPKIVNPNPNVKIVLLLLSMVKQFAKNVQHILLVVAKRLIMKMMRILALIVGSLNNLLECDIIMEKQITYGTTIHFDGTIAKYENWTFETEEEFWNHYSLHADKDTNADIGDLSIRKRIYITVQEYREAKDTKGEEE
jgi:hypothetical protein